MTDRRRPVLERVRWIGGPPDGGKSTVAVALAERDHLARADLGRHGIRASPTELARRTIAWRAER